MNEAAGVYVSLNQLIKLQYKARGFSFLPKQPLDSLLSGRHASRLRGRGVNFEEIRRYLPGDDIRNVNWKVTARTKTPHTKVFTEEKDRPALLVVDQRMSMFFGSKKNMKSVTAAELAALAAWRVMDVGDRVGAFIFNDEACEHVKPHRSSANVMHILETIVSNNKKLDVHNNVLPNRDMFNHVLNQVLRFAKHDYLICIISDFNGANEETKKTLTLLSQHNDVIAAVVYDPLEQELPSVGKLIVGDSNLQLEVDTHDKNLSKKYKELFTERLTNLQDTLRKREIPVLPINTQDDVAKQVQKLLGVSPGVVA